MVVVVGADRLGNIDAVLRQRGFSNYLHVTGRNPAAQRGWGKAMQEMRLMILFTDFLGHNVMRSFRRLAKQHNVPFVACRRSVVSLSAALDRYEAESARCAACGGCGGRS
jgi:hypothetical protein